jgi:eukaryotic translation initiation factor 2-alpha kinase 4
MAPKSPWNKAKIGSKQQSDALTTPNKVKASAKDSTASPAPTTDYVQTQNEEFEVLQAIYMEDFEEIETKSAWSKHSDRAFRLRLKALSDDEIRVALFGKLNATYPKTLPSITVQELVGVRPKTQQKLENLLMTKPKELLGDVMVHEIASAIQDVLEDEAQFKASGEMLPSLEEERVVQEAALSKIAQQQEEEEAKRREEEKAEEDRVLQQMVEEEMNRRRDMKRKSRGVVGDLPNTGRFLMNSLGSHNILVRISIMSTESMLLKILAVFHMKLARTSQ